MSGQQLALAFLGVIGAAWVFSKAGRAGGIALLVLVAPIVAVFALVHSVQSFTGTTRVATVQASPVINSPHTMAISLTTYDSNGNPTRAEYEIQGDRWELNADVVSYQPWCNYIGISNGFSLDRLVTQFDDDQAHIVKPIDLHPSSLFAIPFIERSHYRNGVIEPADGVTYQVYADVRGDVWASHI